MLALYEQLPDQFTLIEYLDWSTVRLTVVLSAAVVVGALVGRAVAKRMSLAAFEWVILSVTFAAAINLIR